MVSNKSMGTGCLQALVVHGQLLLKLFITSLACSDRNKHVWSKADRLGHLPALWTALTPLLPGEHASLYLFVEERRKFCVPHSTLLCCDSCAVEPENKSIASFATAAVGAAAAAAVCVQAKKKRDTAAVVDLYNVVVELPDPSELTPQAVDEVGSKYGMKMQVGAERQVPSQKAFSQSTCLALACNGMKMQTSAELSEGGAAWTAWKGGTFIVVAPCCSRPA
eukprot:1161607-Pelagomonas_calceolata.AAC.2